MKRLFLCAALAAVMMLSGCSAMKIERGLDASGSFVSSASPSVTVQTSADFSAVASGRTLCVVPIENGFIPSQSTEVWYSLHKAENAQIAVMLAECVPFCTWNVSATGVEYEYKPLLYKFYGAGTRDANVLVYTRKVEKDPWMPVFAQAFSAALCPWPFCPCSSRARRMASTVSSSSSRSFSSGEAVPARTEAVNASEAASLSASPENGLSFSGSALSLLFVSEGADVAESDSFFFTDTDLPEAL